LKLSGDPKGLEELHLFKEKDADYLKFILNEAKTNTDLTTTFKSRDGRQRYQLTFHPETDEFTVSIFTKKD
jgi:hypothetical protein